MKIYDIIWKVLFALRPLKPHCFIYGERIEVRQKKFYSLFFSFVLFLDGDKRPRLKENLIMWILSFNSFFSVFFIIFHLILMLFFVSPIYVLFHIHYLYNNFILFFPLT